MSISTMYHVDDVTFDHMTFDYLQLDGRNYHENSFTLVSSHTRLRCVIQQETILDYIGTHILPLDMFGDLDFDDLRFENVRFDIVRFNNPTFR